MKTNIGLIVGEICDTHKKLIWEQTNFVWIDPTRNMSPHQVNEFKNNLLIFTPDKDDLVTLFVWTNDKEIIDSLSPHKYWRVENGKLFKDVLEEKMVGRYELAARNWDTFVEES